MKIEADFFENLYLKAKLSYHTPSSASISVAVLVS